MTPILLITLLGLGAFVAHKVGHTQPAAAPSPTPPQGQRLVTLDANLPDDLLQSTIHAVLYEKNPIALDALADAMQKRGYRCAGFELAYRGWELRGASGPPPARPTSCGDQGQAPGVNIPGVTPEIAAEACKLIDPTLDGSTCAAVLTALGTDLDPANLETFATTLDQTHPRAAAALRQKAQILRGVTQPPVAIADPSAAQQPPVSQAPPDPGQQTPINVQQAPPPINVQQAPPPIVPFPILQHITPAPTPTLNPAAAEMVRQAHLAHAGGAVPNLVAEGAPGVPFTAAEASYAPMEPAIAIAASLSPKLEGTTVHTEGEGNAPAPGALAQAAVAQAAGTLDAAAAAAQGGLPSGAGGFPVVAHTARERPRGYWFLHIRSGDTPWPMTVAKLGANKKDPAALAQLHTMNPHLWTAPGSGVIAAFQPGDEVNIPGAWADALIKKGFKVKKD